MMKNIGIQMKDGNNNNVYPNPFPVGAIYMSVDSRNPSQIFGGTWEQIKDKFLLCAGTTYKPGTTGGEANVTLSSNQMPSHSYTCEGSGNHNHGIRITWGDYAGDANINFNASGGGKLRVDQGAVTMDNGYHGHNIYNSGGNQPHNNMPPYLAVYVWRRTA